MFLLKQIIDRIINFYIRQKKPYKINMIRVALQNFIIFTTIQVQSIYIVGLGASPSQLGLISSIGGLGGAILSVFGGWNTEKYGVKKVFIFGALAAGIGCLVIAMADNLLIVTLGIFIYISSLRISMNMCSVVCGVCLKNSERATGMQLCDIISALPKLVAPIMAAYLITAFGGLNTKGIKPLYFMGFIGFCILAIFTWKMFTNPNNKKVTKELDKGGLSFLNGFYEMFKQGKELKKWIAYRVFSVIPTWTMPIYWPLFAKELKNADQFVIGYMATAMMVMPILFSLPMGRFADIIGRKRLLYITTPIYCLSILLFIYAQSQTMLIVSAFFQGLLFLNGVTQRALEIEVVHIDFLEKWLGVIGLLRGVFGEVISPIICGIIWINLGPLYVFYFMITVLILSLVLLARVHEG